MTPTIKPSNVWKCDIVGCKNHGEFVVDDLFSFCGIHWEYITEGVVSTIQAAKSQKGEK